MTKITTIVTVHNHCEFLDDCLDSCKQINGNLFVYITSNDHKPYKIAEKYTGNIKYLPFANDFSKIKNKIIQDTESEWLFFVEANEKIIRGAKDVENLCNDSNIYRINLIQENIITKPIRLWNKSKNLQFQNPVYESIKSEGLCTNIFLQNNLVDNFDLNKELLNLWQQKTPFAIEPLYYKSCLYLTKFQWDDFINTANEYLFKENKKQASYVMTKYYLGFVFCHIKKDYQKAIKCVIECLSLKPIMAEFWCLLGDIYYALDNFYKAYSFYENAKLLGSRRLKNDEWPFHIDKYKTYPESMMNNCQDILKKTKQYLVNDI